MGKARMRSARNRLSKGGEAIGCCGDDRQVADGP
jgi:hypothetical protein